MSRRGGKFLSAEKLKRSNNLVLFKKKEQNEEWRNGRRVVELGILVDNLRKCCRCGVKLHLSDIITETRYGLGSILYVQCAECKKINSVPTGKRHCTKAGTTDRQNCFDINTKLAAAMLNAGIGEQQVNNILAELNLPTVCQKTLKKREREIGNTMEINAELSCERGIETENACITKFERHQSTPSTPQAVVSTDGAWQRRGNGLTRNSLSGHVTVIGKYSKKCVSYSVAKKRCRICDHACKFGKLSRVHKCRKNWTGSSKGMEPFLTIKCLRILQDKGLHVRKLIMDDDTTTYVRAKQVLGDTIEKASDKNHVLKNIGKELYKLKDIHRLSYRVVTHLKKCLAYAISHNQSNKEGLVRNVSAIVPHTFGNHTLCPSSWCRMSEKGDAYRHSTLPYGKDLSGEELHKDLDTLFRKFTTESTANKLIDLSSSNPNENINNMISKKAPKAQHYSGSDSLDFRVAAGVAQKNDGHSYIVEVNERHGLSPGKYTTKRFGKLDEKRRKKTLQSETNQVKKRRIELNEIRNCNSFSQEVREGKTYESNIDLGEECSDIEDLPTPLTKPQAEIPFSQDMDIIIFDLETTGLDSECDIIQIAAKHHGSEECFSTFVKPARGYIPRKITNITGIEMHSQNMYYNLEEVQYLKASEALTMFLEWLSKYRNVVLVAHNALFDARVLLKSLITHSMSHKMHDIVGFLDTLKLSKKAYPGRGKREYNQTALVKDLLNKTYVAHNATEDVNALNELFRLLSEKVNQDYNIVSVDQIIFNIERLKNEKMNISTYNTLVQNKVICKTQAVALSGIGYSANHIEIAYQRSGKDGLFVLLKNNIARVAAACSALSNYFSMKDYKNTESSVCK